MAEVVVQQGANAAPPGSSVSGDVNGIIGWFAHYWWVILLFVVLIVGAIVIIWFVYQWGLKNKRKDPMYVQYENTLDACKLNGNRLWIIKKRRWKLLFFSLITAPLFSLTYLLVIRGEHWIILFLCAFFGIIIWFFPAWFWYKDWSMRVINVDKVTCGFYRGHAKRQDGFIYLLMKVGKKWLVLDNIIVVRIPENVLTMKTVLKKNKDGETRKEEQWDRIQINSFVSNENGWYIFIPYTSLVKEATYFYDVTLIDDSGKILDERQRIAKSYHLITQIQMAEQEYSHLGKVTNNAVDSNVGVVAEKKKPEKQRDVNTGEGNQQ